MPINKPLFISYLSYNSGNNVCENAQFFTISHYRAVGYLQPTSEVSQNLVEEVAEQIAELNEVLRNLAW